MEPVAYTSHSPSCIPLYLRFKKSATSSLSPLCTYKGHGCSPFNQAVLRNSYSSAQIGFLCIPRKRLGLSWPYFIPKVEELSRPCNDIKLNTRNISSRNVVVRSELAGTGTPDSVYPLSGAELKLGSKVRGICFYAVTAVVAIVLIVLMLVGHPFVLLLDQYRRKFHHFIAKLWASLTVSPFFRIEIEGLENLPPSDTPAVYISNHQSFLDIYTLLTLGRCFKFISKTSIFLFPVVGWAMSMMGLIPLKRMDSQSQLECFKKCTELIKKGGSVYVFPEGTRSKDGKLGDFKKGAFSIAAKTGAPVVPLTLIGTGKIMPSGMEGIVNTGSVKVVIHKPIQGSNAEVLCSEARNIIADTLSHQS